MFDYVLFLPSHYQNHEKKRCYYHHAAANLPSLFEANAILVLEGVRSLEVFPSIQLLTHPK
jgi:hypothetical protein